MDKKKPKAPHGKHEMSSQVNAKVSPEAKEGLQKLAAQFNLSLNGFLNELGTGSFEVTVLSGES